MHRIIGHMDADGHCSSAIVYHHLVNHNNVDPKDVDFVHINYGMELPDRLDYENDSFYMVDFSLQPAERMLDFAKKCGDRLVWIDHHETAIRAVENELADVKGIREVGRAACELTWEYFFPTECPQIVDTIGTYDIWDNTDKGRWEEYIMPMQLFLRSFDSRAVHSEDKTEGVRWWCRMFDEHEVPEEVFSTGRALWNYSQREDFRAMKGKSYRGTFAGHSAIFINRAGNSTMFEKFTDVSKIDLMVWYEHTRGKYWSIHLYSVNPDVHCGKLAERIGHSGPIPSGGGHQGAAGFQTTWDYFESLVKVEEWSQQG
jgi:hypothetical protein